MTDVVSKLWSFCHTLRHDGVDYSDYIEQITYLLFLRMAGERGLKLPTGQQWEDVRSLDDNWLLAGYQSVLDTLGKQADLLGEIFDGAQSKFTRSESLRHIMNLIEETKWSSLDVDIQAAAFEGLLDRAASEGKKGAGQYFTPRLLIESIVRCIKPNPLEREGFSIADPACGTGGFLKSANLNEIGFAVTRTSGKS